MQINNISKTLGKKEVLKDISFEINNNDKIGIIGINGSGKSTLLKIIAGHILPDFGSINSSHDVAYLKQEIAIEDYDLTILDYIKKESGIKVIEDKINVLQENLTEDNMEQYGLLLDKFLELDGYNIESNIERYLNKFNINKSVDNKIFELSGGEKIKILLISMFLCDKNILLLDEPTNNLDIQSVNFLKDYLISSNKSMLIVSHDKNFLSDITNKTLKLENGSCVLYPYNYETYLQVQQDLYNKDYENYIKSKEQIKQISSQINNVKEKSNSNKKQPAKDNDKLARNFKAENAENKTGAKLKKLSEQLDDIKNTVNEFKSKQKLNYIIEQDDINFNLKDIMFKNLICGYNNFSTKPITANIKQGSRVLISGVNGTGKTTLIKTLLNELNIKSGEILLDKNIKFGYLEQNTIVNKDMNVTVYEYLKNNLQNVSDGLIFNVLHNFQISYEDRDKKYSNCSSGERTKINLAKLSLEKVNALILDEPTNHLDLEASEILYNAVQNFKGTIFAISHNLAFIEILEPNIIIDLDDGKVVYK